MKYVLLGLFAVFLVPFTAPGAQAANVIDMAFPVVGGASFVNDYYYPRSGGRTHLATDLMAKKMTPVVATVDGIIAYAPMVQPTFGYMLTLRGDDGYTYNYLHLNNDTPGTDDGRGGPANAYAPGIAKGVRVERGQLLGWLGDSGNAEWTAPHVHFEIFSGKTRVNPYPHLLAAQEAEAFRLATLASLSINYDRQAEEISAPTISDDLGLESATEATACEADSLVRTADVSTVFYCGRNGARYAFPNEDVYFSWYKDFSTVKTITSEEMATTPLKGTVTFKPGSYLVRLQSTPRVYAVARGGELRWVPSVDIAQALYGPDWGSAIRDISDAFFTSYRLGVEVTASK